MFGVVENYSLYGNYCCDCFLNESRVDVPLKRRGQLLNIMLNRVGGIGILVHDLMNGQLNSSLSLFE